MSFRNLLSKELLINYDISFEEAGKRFPGISRENFDLIKYEHRRDVLGIKPKSSKKKSSGKKHISTPRYNTPEVLSGKKKLEIDNYRKELTAFEDLELLRHGARETLIDGIVSKNINAVRVGMTALFNVKREDGTIKLSSKKEQPSLKEIFSTPEILAKYTADPHEPSEIDKQLLLDKEQAFKEIAEQLEEE